MTIGIRSRTGLPINFNGLPRPVPRPALSGACSAFPHIKTTALPYQAANLDDFSCTSERCIERNTVESSITCGPDAPMPSVKRPSET